MAWSDFEAKLKAQPIHCEETPEASRYGGIPDMYTSPIIAASSPAENKVNNDLCFVSVGICDMAIASLFVTEPNIIIMDWNKQILNTVQSRIGEMVAIFEAENFNPSKIVNNKKILDNDFEFPYDFEYWERQNMALIAYYRRLGDSRADELNKQVEEEYVKFRHTDKQLQYLDLGHKYKENEFDCESMQEFSIENQRVLLEEKYYMQNCKIFFSHVDENILRIIKDKHLLCLNINLLKHESIKQLVNFLQEANLKISRFNLMDLLDELVVESKYLGIFIQTLSELQCVMTADACILVNHINDFSLCLPFEKTILEMKEIMREVQELEINPRIGDVPILEQYSENYLKSFIKYCTVSCDKRTFYPNC